MSLCDVKNKSAEVIILCAFIYVLINLLASRLGGDFLSLALAGLTDIVADQLLRMRLRASHDEVTRSPEIARGIFPLQAGEIGEYLFRGLLAHDAHEIAG